MRFRDYLCYVQFNVLFLSILMLSSCAAHKEKLWLRSMSHSDTLEVRRYLVYNGARYQRQENVRFLLFYKRNVLNMAFYNYEDGNFLEDVPLQKRKVKTLSTFEHKYEDAGKLFGKYYLFRIHKVDTVKEWYISEQANEHLMNELGIYETIEALYRSLITSHKWYSASRCDFGAFWKEDKLVLLSRKHLADSVFTLFHFDHDQRLSFIPINGKRNRKVNRGRVDGVLKWQVDVDRLRISWRFKGIYKVCYFKILASTPNKIVLIRDSGRNKYIQLY